MTLDKKRIAILGAGRSGLAAARLVLKHGGLPHVFDGDPRPFPDWPTEIPLTTGATEQDGLDFEANLVVISPGMESTTPFVRAFCHKAEELMGEIELAYRFYSGTIIAITGTNGKTTTTELIERILLQAGHSAKACGNYGYPFAEVALAEPQPEFVALELSSFQLETIHDFRAKVAVWLNFAPDHMDRYTSIEEYRDAKRHIFDNQTEEDFAIVRAGEELPPVKSKTEFFSSEDTTIPVHYKNNAIYEGDTILINLEGTKMNVKHNAENVMAALLAVRAAGIPVEAVQATLTRFAPPLHRCELIRILDGVEYLNDSKATNIHALEAALKSQKKPVVLIVGGKDKGLDYTCLCPLLREKTHDVITFGQIKDQLFDTFESSVPTCKCETLSGAVLKAQELSHAGDVVLFSPGTSSFDMFSGYEQRGDVFREIVLTL